MHSTMRVPAARKTPAKAIRTLLAAAALLLLGNPGTARAASPPQLLNYQGVLRDANGFALSGEYSMVFRFVDAGSGDDILIDEHLGGAAGTAGVTATNGLFNVQIGSGNIIDGAGAGNYTSLAEVFRDFNNVVLSIEVGGEVLTPTIPVSSAAYALNSSHLDGLRSDQFLRTDVDEIAFGQIWFADTPLGSGIAHGPAFISPASANPDDTLFGVAVSFQERFRVDAEGDTFISGDIFLAGGAEIDEGFEALFVRGGDQITDDLHLEAGSSFSEGRIIIKGSEEIVFDSGNGAYEFFNAGQGTGLHSYLDLDHFSMGGRLQLDAFNNTFQSTIQAGDDDLLSIRSDQSFDMVIDEDNNSANGVRFNWWANGQPNNGTKLAEMDEFGNLKLAGTLSQNQSLDLAESFIASEPLQPGDVVGLDRSRPGAVNLASETDDSAVIGVVSTRPGVLLGDAPFTIEVLRSVWGEELYEEYLAERDHLRGQVLSTHRELPFEHAVEGLALERFFRSKVVPVALAGRVPVKVDAGYGSIRIGDLLTTSPTPGHAMRAKDPVPGSIIGKAMESLDDGTGTIMVFVMLR